MDNVTNRALPLDDAPTGVEALLRAAARFTPDAPVPDALAFRALERAGLLSGTPRRRRAAGFRPLALCGGTLAGALAVAAFVSLTAPGGPPAITARPDRAEPSTTAPLSRDDAREPATSTFVAQAVSQAMPPLPAPRARRTVATTNGPARVRRDGRAAAARRFGSFRRHELAHRPLFVASAPPPKASWRTRLVEQKNYGVLAPAWVTFHAPTEGAQAEGEIVGAVPVVVDLPLDSPDVAYAGGGIVPVDYNPHSPQGEFRP